MTFDSDQNYVKIVEFHCVLKEIRSGLIAGQNDPF